MGSSRGLRAAWLLIIAAFIAACGYFLGPMALKVWNAYHEQGPDG
jgi:hypothetical protein